MHKTTTNCLKSLLDVFLVRSQIFNEIGKKANKRNIVGLFFVSNFNDQYRLKKGGLYLWKKIKLGFLHYFKFDPLLKADWDMWNSLFLRHIRSMFSCFFSSFYTTHEKDKKMSKIIKKREEKILQYYIKH